MTWSRKSRRGLSLAAAMILAATLAAPTVRAQSGDPDAQYRAGFADFQKRDYADACKEFQAAAAQGHVASKSMIQIVNGYGYRCAMPSANTAAAALPEIRRLYQGALAEARLWHGDAALTYAEVSSLAHPGYYTISFLFVSPSARETLSLVSSAQGGLAGKMGNNAKTEPLPSSFLDLAAAVGDAHRAGMRGAIDNATLTVWQRPGGTPLPGWLLHTPDDRTATFLIGALDGRAYPVGQYTYLTERDDQQIRAIQQAMRQSAPASQPQSQHGDPCSGTSMMPMYERLNPWIPCNEAAVRRVFQQSASNYDLWQRGLRPTPN
jgi:hypothetical protein